MCLIRPPWPVMDRLHLATCVALLFVSHQAHAGRTWQSNLNYNNPHNWNTDRVPCESDRVIFKSTESIVLEFPEGKTSLRELVLPSYVELMLPAQGSVQFTGQQHSSTCDGQDAVFKHTNALQWTDPANWDKWSKATPDLERLPCATEAVRFPSGTTYKVLMPEKVKLGSLEINGMTMDSLDWMLFSNSDSGDRQFFKDDGNAVDIEISGRPCPESQWCYCENEYLRPVVCKRSCPIPLCKNPVKPAGFCCPICGVYFLIDGHMKSKEELTKHINSFINGKEIVWHASRMKKFLQVILVEKGQYSGQVPSIAEDLKTSLANSGLGWTIKEFYASGHIWYPTTFGQVALHFFSLMVFAALSLAAIITFYSKNWSQVRFSSLKSSPFMFARFENQSGEVVVSNEPQPSASTQATPTQAFDNPMYGATDQEPQNIIVENPTYTEIEETSSIEDMKEGITLESTHFCT